MRHTNAVIKMIVLFGLMFVVVAACGSDAPTAVAPTSAPSTATSEATATGSPATQTPVPPSPAATATPEGFYAPETPLAALMLDTYAVLDGQPAPYLTTDLPIIAGTAAAFWYQAMGRYVVVFDGLDLAATGPICPGASIFSDGAFQHISNGPTAEGACEGAPTLAQSPAGAYACDGVLLYVTEIPAGTEGVLYGTVERYVDGTIYGVTGSTRGEASAAAAIDMTECRPLP